MVKSLMVQGTASSVGKTLIVAALCRIFRQDGYSVAPFKAQNMALNSFITADGKEMGRAQVMQAEACGLAPDARMNPVLLKPTGRNRSQVIVHGLSTGDMAAQDYFANKAHLVPAIMEAYESLGREHDILVLEGAGSPAEINLKHEDIVNMGMAKRANAPVVLAGDIDRGGVFAALAGTLMLLEEDERARVKGLIINKFRGDPAILAPGLAMMEERLGLPVLGVIPHMDIQMDDEDSLTGRFERRHTMQVLDIAVVRLPYIANFSDFSALEYQEGAGVRYLSRVAELGQPDLLILPGSKNTLHDLRWLKESGFAAKIRQFAEAGKPVFGLCGGLQMLGRHVDDPLLMEGGEAGRTGEAGLGLLPCATVFRQEKLCTRVKGVLANVGGIFSSLSALPFEGYEIHMGASDCTENLVQHGNVYGSYVHGIFDSDSVRAALFRALLASSGLDPESFSSFDLMAFKEEQYDKLAATVRASVDIPTLYQLMEKGG